MATKTFKVALSLDNPRIIQSGIDVRSFDKQSIKIAIELTKNSQTYQIPAGAQIKISLLKLARQEQKIILDVPFTSAEAIEWLVPDYLDGYQGEVRVGVYLIVGAENIDVGYFNIASKVSDIDKAAEEFTDSVMQGWDQIEADLAEIRATITQVNTLASDFTTDVATKQSDVTSKYNAFDDNVTQANQTIDEILALQPQFQSVLDETTGKDVISAPEVILARGGAETLGERLDSDKSEFTAQLAQNEKKTTDIFSRNNSNRIPTLSVNAEKEVVPLVSFVDDDGNEAILSKLKPVSETHGVPFSIALIGNHLETGKGIKITDALDLQNRLGWEIASHGYNHVGFQEPGVTLEQMEYEAKYSAEYMRSKGFDVKNFVYPGGQYDDQSIRAVARYYNSGLSTGSNINGTPLRNFKLGRLSFPQPAPNNTLAWYKSKVDEAVANNGWLIWMLHCGQENFDSTQQQILNDLIMYIKSIGADVVTIQEALDKIGNVLSVNDNELFISADGKNNIANHIYSRGDSITGIETVTFDTVPSELEAGKTYVSSISTPNAISKSPSGARGVLTIYRTFTTYHSYRTYVDADKNFYVSYSNSSGTGWGDFSKMLNASAQQEYTLPTATIPASGYYKFHMNPVPIQYNKFQYAIAHPIDPLPVGLIYSAHHNGTGGSVEVRLFNTTSNAITLTDFRWKFIISDVR